MTHQHKTSRPPAGTRHSVVRWEIGLVSGVALLALLVACTPSAPPSPPTVQAARTEVVTTAQSQVTAAVATVQTQATAVAPTVSAAQTQVAPLAAATQTQVAPTVAAVRAAVQATATAVAPTVQAVATQVAPTVQAVATQAVGAVATSVAQSPVQVTAVTVSPDDTTVVVKNNGSSSVNLRGWTLVMGPVFAVALPDIDLGAGQTRTLHFAPGITTPTDVYLFVGSNLATASLVPGTHVVLVAPRNDIASVYSIS